MPCGVSLNQGVLLPRVYSTITSPLWLELRGAAGWQATPSWTMYRLACHRLLPWLRVMFAMVLDAASAGSNKPPWLPQCARVGRCCLLFPVPRPP